MPDATDSRILEITTALARELHATPPSEVDLDSSLDREFGLESLARAELLHRIEREFGVELSDQTLGAAESPRDLATAGRPRPRCSRKCAP